MKTAYEKPLTELVRVGSELAVLQDEIVKNSDWWNQGLGDAKQLIILDEEEEDGNGDARPFFVHKGIWEDDTTE